MKPLKPVIHVFMLPLLLSACMEMNITMDFKSRHDGDMIMSFALAEDALKAMNKQNGSKNHPFCEKFKKQKTRRYKKLGFDICEVTLPLSVEQMIANPNAFTGAKQGEHRFGFKQVGEHFRLTFDFDTRTIKKSIKASDNPQMVYAIKELVKDKGLTFILRAKKILKTSGKKSENNTVSTWTIPFMRMIESKKPFIKNHAEFTVAIK